MPEIPDNTTEGTQKSPIQHQTVGIGSDPDRGGVSFKEASVGVTYETDVFDPSLDKYDIGSLADSNDMEKMYLRVLERVFHLYGLVGHDHERDRKVREAVQAMVTASMPRDEDHRLAYCIMGTGHFRNSMNATIRRDKLEPMEMSSPVDGFMKETAQRTLVRSLFDFYQDKVEEVNANSI
jgi:hypothetical protein